MNISQILAWEAEDGLLYLSRDKALKHSPNGTLKEIWGVGGYDCTDSSHSNECNGAGDIENHIFPYYRTLSITRLMGRILSCCGNKISSVRSCGCSHVALILMEKLEKV